MTVKLVQNLRPEYSFELIVIGAGAGGLTAALSAAEKGINVLLLERDHTPTGSTSLSAGLIPAAGTHLQKQAGIQDSAAIFANDIKAKAHGKNDSNIVDTISQASAETIDWLTATQGLDLHLVQGFKYPGHSQMRMHGPKSRSGADLQAMLLAAAKRNNIDIVTDAHVVDLYIDEGKNVIAVAYTTPNGNMDIVGCENLILACNGFGGNPEMVAKYIPEMADAIYFGHTSNTGEALTWGLELGAQVKDLGSYQGHGSVAIPHGVLLTWAVISQGGIQLNKLGQRFANEMSGYSEQAQAVLQQPDQEVWNIYDARSEEPALAFQEYQDLVKMGAIKQADNLNELAQKTDLPTAALHASFSAIESYANNKAKDPFDRNFTTNLLLKPPYRAAKVTGALFHTQGGLVIDTQARVLDQDDKSLPNLYAIGGAARGLCGPAAYGYLSGNGLLSAVVLGRIAALSIANKINRLSA